MTHTFTKKLHIKKRSVLQKLAYFIFVMPFLLSTLEFIGAPDFVKYSIDVAWVLCVALIFIQRKLKIDKKLLPFILFTFGFLLYTLLVYIFSYQSIFYYLWGFRNNFRFFFTFLIFCIVFKEEDAENCLKFVDIIFWINMAVSLFQFFVLGLEQDYLGGIFGIQKGCNGYSIVFFSIVISKSILKFMSREESALRCFSKCGMVLILSAMAELKFFFVVFMIILLLSTAITSFSWRKFLIILVSALLVFFTGSILTQLFGESSNISFSRIWELITSSNYSSTEDFSRFNAIPMINDTIMTNSAERLFGLGLGNCDTSAFPICNTPFYETYSHLHYNWFSSAFMFLETGYIGLSLYLLFFVLCFVVAFRQKKKPNSNKLYCNMALIMSVISVSLIFYNASLRNEVAYMVFFVLALPLINSRSNIDELNRRLV